MPLVHSGVLEDDSAVVTAARKRLIDSLLARPVVLTNALNRVLDMLGMPLTERGIEVRPFTIGAATWNGDALVVTVLMSRGPNGAYEQYCAELSVAVAQDVTQWLHIQSDFDAANVTTVQFEVRIIPMAGLVVRMGASVDGDADKVETSWGENEIERGALLHELDPTHGLVPTA